MEKKMLFVFNPHAGKAKIKPKLADIIDVFIKNGYWVTTYTTQAAADARRVICEHAAEYDLIVCSGGDGTLNEAVNGILDAGVDVPIGYIPAGSTNDYGRSLGIPGNMMQASNVAVKGTPFQSDLGWFNGESFVYVAAFGAFTGVSYQTSQTSKNIFGHAAYLFEGAKSIAEIRPYEMKVEIDGEIIEGKFLYGMITNTLSVGGFRNLTGKEVMLDDGLFEVTFISEPTNPMQWQSMLTGVVIENYESPEIITRKAKCVKVLSQEAIPWTLDGEFGGEHKEVVIENHMQAFRILVDEQRMKIYSEQLALGLNEEEAKIPKDLGQ